MTSVPEPEPPDEESPQKSSRVVASTVVSKRAKWLITLLTLIPILIVTVYFLLPRGVIVIVNNVGHVPLQAVWIHVTGRSYTVGDIPPGKSRSVRVHPTNEGHVEVSFRTPDEPQKRMVAGCYFGGQYYSGTVTVDLDGMSNQPVDVRCDISLTLW